MAVYMIQAGKDGPVKIGVGYNPKARLAGMQTSHYETLTIIRLLDGGIGEERILHDRYASLRIRGEWFRFCPTMLGDVGIPDLPKQKAGSIDRKELWLGVGPEYNELRNEVRLALFEFLPTSSLSEAAFGLRAASDENLVVRLRQGLWVDEEKLKEALAYICLQTEGRSAA
jgi:hypothetical protein